MSTIQYYYNEESGIVCAVDVPPKEVFVTLPDTRELKISAGLSLCSPEDNFNHKIGRELATSRLVYDTWKLYSVVWEDERQYLIFKRLNEFLTFTLYPTSNRAYFINYEVMDT